MSLGDGIEVRRLCIDDEPAFRRALARAAADQSVDGVFALRWDAGMSFVEYLGRLDGDARSFELPEGWGPATLLFGFVGGEIVGRVSIRHELNDFLREIGGHIGYVVLEEVRRRGHGTALLRAALSHACALGIGEALLTCKEDNVASRRMIEKAGGRFDGIATLPDGTLRKRRYWVPTASDESTVHGGA